MNNSPLRRMIEQLVQEREINHKEGEIFNAFENTPFDPTLESKKNCLRKIKERDLGLGSIQEKIWKTIEKVVALPSKKRAIIISESVMFDFKISKTLMSVEKNIILKKIHLFILEESIKSLLK
jgi:hypothetical protein